MIESMLIIYETLFSGCRFIKGWETRVIRFIHGLYDSALVIWAKKINFFCGPHTCHFLKSIRPSQAFLMIS